ncbi:MAG: pilus assembly protein PilM [Verrucomicrobiota bacterium]
MTIFDQLSAVRKVFRTQRKPPQDLVVVDFDAAAVRCVRLKLGGSEIVVTATDILPAVDISDEAQVKAFELPKNMASRYIAICIPGYDAIVKLLNLPGALDGQFEEQIREHMGVEEGSYRFGYRIVSQTHSETRLLTVAIPESQVQAACAIFPSGLPVPVTVELGGLAVMSSFLHGPGKTVQDEAIGVVEFGSRVTYFAFFKKLELILIRKFDFGHFNLLDRIEKSMGFDRQTAQDVVVDRSFDISQLVKDLADPFVKQLVISKHFVERRENCHISKIYVADDPRVSRDWLNEIKAALGLDASTWHPFEGVKLMPDALPQKFEKCRSQFAAAMGAAMAMSEEGLIGPGG